MTATSAEQIPWLYVVPVLAPVLVYSGLALRWAGEQFNSEEVLFRGLLMRGLLATVLPGTV